MHTGEIDTDLDVISFLIGDVMDSIQTVHHKVLRHPLVRVLSSLGRDPNDLCRSTKVNLQPLVTIVVLSRPRAHVTTTPSFVKSREVWAVVVVPSGGGREELVFDSSCLHSHWLVTNVTCRMEGRTLTSAFFFSPYFSPRFEKESSRSH